MNNLDISSRCPEFRYAEIIKLLWLKKWSVWVELFCKIIATGPTFPSCFRPKSFTYVWIKLSPRISRGSPDLFSNLFKVNKDETYHWTMNWQMVNNSYRGSLIIRWVSYFATPENNDHAFLSILYTSVLLYPPGSPQMFHRPSARWIGPTFCRRSSPYCVYRDKQLCSLSASIDIQLNTALENITIEFVIDSVVLFFGRRSWSCNLTEHVASPGLRSMVHGPHGSISFGVHMSILAMIVLDHGSGKVVGSMA